jgi:hypothetical protein
VVAFQTHNGGGSYSSVPVEGCSTTGTPAGCGEGTRDSHWTETIFDTELMTGWIDSGASHPLSATTIASLGDLGYTVDLTQADDFTIVSSTAGLRARVRSATSVSHHVGNDLLIIPLGVVDDRGARQR